MFSTASRFRRSASNPVAGASRSFLTPQARTLTATAIFIRQLLVIRVFCFANDTCLAVAVHRLSKELLDQPIASVDIRPPTVVGAEIRTRKTTFGMMATGGPAAYRAFRDCQVTESRTLNPPTACRGAGHAGRRLSFTRGYYHGVVT